MIKYFASVISAPRRVWLWATIYPYEAIGYGLVLTFLSLASRFLIAAIGLVAIVAGICTLFRSEAR